jgi:hypothetical protein
LKKLAVLIIAIVLVVFLSRARERAVHSVSLAHKADAVERAKGISALEEVRQLDMLANPAPRAGQAEADAVDRTPFHFLAVSPAGKYVKVDGPLKFRSRDPVRLVLEIHPALVADDMPDPAVGAGQPNRPDVRAANTSFEVLADENGRAKPVPYRAYCSPAPEPSDITVSLELGGGHDALDAAAKKIHVQELSGAISSADARSRLAALREGYVPNARGSYQIRAVYRNGRLATAPVTVIITD